MRKIPSRPFHKSSCVKILSFLEKRGQSHEQSLCLWFTKKKGLSRLFPHWLHCFHFFALGLWERDGGALVGERVRLPVDQPAAVRPPRRADGLGRTPGFLTLRPLPNRQWETKLQVTPLVWTKEGDNCFFQAKEFLNCSLIFCTTC